MPLAPRLLQPLVCMSPWLWPDLLAVRWRTHMAIGLMHLFIFDMARHRGPGLSCWPSVGSTHGDRCACSPLRGCARPWCWQHHGSVWPPVFHDPPGRWAAVALAEFGSRVLAALMAISCPPRGDTCISFLARLAEALVELRSFVELQASRPVLRVRSAPRDSWSLPPARWLEARCCGVWRWFGISAVINIVRWCQLMSRLLHTS